MTRKAVADAHAHPVKPPRRARRQKGTVPLPPARRRAVYLVSGGVWATGGLWLIYHYFMSVKDEFGFDTVHPWEKWWLIAHAAVAIWATWMFGNLWLHHIKLGWNVRARWISGGSLFLVMLWLIGTGFLLYYVGNDKIRNLTALLHWIPGLAALVLFLLHLSFAWLRPKEAKARRGH